MAPVRALLVLLVLAAPLAGCFGAEEVPDERRLSASGGRVSEGWAYDGAGLADASAMLEATFANAENQGGATVTFQHAGSRWVVTFDQFAGAKDFQDGGIAFDLVEHGDTGVADTSIPRITALVAAWGTATVTRDGVPVVGKAGDRWAAHLMASADTVRGPDGRIAKADGATPYDPAAPGDARVLADDPQVVFWIKSPDGEDAKRAPVAASAPLAFSGPQATQSVEVPVETGALSATVTVNASAGAAPVAVGQVRVRVLDAGGNVTGSQEGNVLPNQPFSWTFEAPPDALAGPLTVEVTGTGAFGATVDSLVAYDDHPFLVFTWDEPTLE